MRLIQITEEDKNELSQLGHNAIKSVQEFLECMDKVTDGQISREMAEFYGERQGVRGTGPYSRYNRRDSGGFNERRPMMRGGETPTYYNERGRFEDAERYESPAESEHMRYGNRYDY